MFRALFVRSLPALKGSGTGVALSVRVVLTPVNLSQASVSEKLVVKRRSSHSQLMSSKILYRRILPPNKQGLPSGSPPTLSHPHKTPSTLAHPHNPPPQDNEVTSTSSDTQTEADKPLVQPTHQTIPSTKGNESDSVELTDPPVVSQEPTSSDEVEAAAKVTLGEITEIKGVIFDMDGTLTLPVLRFAEMKEKLGLKPTDDILPAVQKLPPEERVKAFEIIEEFEREGIENMKLQPGVLDLFHFLAERDIKRALMTRNAWVPTNAFLKRLQEEHEANKDQYPSLSNEELFSKIITREFEPCKPHPAPVFEICKTWELKPDEVVIVGDDKTDMMCGLRAGVGVNILLRNERNKKQPDYSHFTVNALTEIITLMSSLMTVPFKQEEP